jgi:REP element-mobilizing transposase RayT
MRSRYRVAELDRAHFVSSTIVEWLPVFTSAACCDIVLGTLAHCREKKGLRIYAWVILDNHFHAILAAPDLSAVLRDLKSFTAMKLVQQLESERREWLLDQFRYYRAPNKPTEFQVWQEGSHPQIVRGDSMMQQRRDYLQANPVKRGWVTAPEPWRYSSAHEWVEGAQPLLVCDPWR